MVVLIPGTGVARGATAALARALDGVRFVVVERSQSTDTDRRSAVSGECAAPDECAAPNQCSVMAESEAIARHLPAGALAYEVVVVGQGDGAQVAIELARRLERPGAQDRAAAAGRVRAVVVAGALPPDAHDSSGSSGSPGAPEVEPIAAPLHVWAGTEDLLAPAGNAMLGWREFTDAPTTFGAFDGPGDFLLTRVGEVTRRLRRVLGRV